MPGISVFRLPIGMLQKSAVSPDKPVQKERSGWFSEPPAPNLKPTLRAPR